MVQEYGSIDYRPIIAVIVVRGSSLFAWTDPDTGSILARIWNILSLQFGNHKGLAGESAASTGGY